MVYEYPTGKNVIATIAELTEAILYGSNHTIAKEVMPECIQVLALVQLRCTNSTVLFRAASLCIPRQPIESKDYPRILLSTV